VENGIVFIQAFAEVIGDHFEARTRAVGVEPGDVFGANL
jgi:hypothetical protein